MNTNRRPYKQTPQLTSSVRNILGYNRAMARNNAIQQARSYVSVPRPVMGGNTRMLPANLSSRSPEVKSLDVPSATYTLNTTAVVTPLNLIQTGSSYFDRIGRRIEMKNVRISGVVRPIRTQNAVGGDYVRICVVYDRQTNGALPSLADVFQTTDQNGANTSTSFSGVNLNNRDRFTILRDLRIVPPNITITAGSPSLIGVVDPVEPMTNIDFFIRLKGLTTQYKADSAPAVIGDIATGGLFLITFGFLASGSEGWSTTLESRLRYNDS